MKTVVILLVGLFSSLAFSAKWEAPAEVKVSKICGSLVKENSSWDGIQATFSEKNSLGKTIATYFLSPSSETATTQLSALKLNQVMDVCVVGFPSGAQMIDSSKSFFTFEIL